MNFELFKKTAAEIAEALGIRDYELYYEEEESDSVSAFRHEIREFTSDLTGGVCFRCIIDGHMGYASTESLTEEDARALVRRAAENAKSLESEEEEFLQEGGKSYQEPEKKEVTLPGTDELIALALKGQDLLYAEDPAVTDGSETSVAAVRRRLAIYNSKGLDLSYENKSAMLASMAVVTDGQEMNDSFEFKTGEVKEEDLPDLVTKAVADAKAKLSADVAPTGSYPVVFAPKAMASFMMVFSQVFSSERARKGLSALKGKEGECIASPLLTLTDDPFYKDSACPIGFDAEGTPTYRKNVIEKGVLKTLLYNLKSAAAEGKETTGNASKAGYNAEVSIRPFTMVIEAGEDTSEELLKKAGNGVYIDSLGGLHAGANVISGDFSLQSAGFMIEDGKLGKAVKSFTVAGNFYELLKNIQAVSDTAVYRGMGGITAFASPEVLVTGLSIAGK